ARFRRGRRDPLLVAGALVRFPAAEEMQQLRSVLPPAPRFPPPSHRSRRREAGPYALSPSPILILSMAGATAPDKGKVSRRERYSKPDCASHTSLARSSPGGSIRRSELPTGRDCRSVQRRQRGAAGAARTG